MQRYGHQLVAISVTLLVKLKHKHLLKDVNMFNAAKHNCRAN